LARLGLGLAGLGLGLAGLGLGLGLAGLGLGLRLGLAGLGLEHAICQCLRLPVRWRVARRAAHDVRPRPFGTVLLRRRLCLPHGPRRSLRQRVLLPVQ
jgi:hypothetical protein